MSFDVALPVAGRQRSDVRRFYAPTGMNDFQFTVEHRRWARARQRAHGGSIADYLTLIAAQDGMCAFSGVPLIFDRAHGGGYTPGCTGSHPIYAALDHCAPGSRSDGFQVVSYALNDLKGHLPLDCFRELTQTPSWQRLMAAWRRQQLLDVADRQAFRALLRPPNQAQ